MGEKLKLDQVDKQILQILQKNAKITNAQLSKEIGLSPAPTLERVKKLENAGVIASYHAKINPLAVELGVCTYVIVSLKNHKKSSFESFSTKINKIDEVIECHHITGAGDIILKIITHDIQSYEKLVLERISEIDEVDNMQTMVILSTFKDSKIMPI